MSIHDLPNDEESQDEWVDADDDEEEHNDLPVAHAQFCSLANNAPINRDSWSPSSSLHARPPNGSRISIDSCRPRHQSSGGDGSILRTTRSHSLYRPSSGQQPQSLSRRLSTHSQVRSSVHRPPSLFGYPPPSHQRLSVTSVKSYVSNSSVQSVYEDALDQNEWMEIDGGGAYEDLDKAEEIVKGISIISALYPTQALRSAAEARSRYSALSGTLCLSSSHNSSRNSRLLFGLQSRNSIHRNRLSSSYCSNSGPSNLQINTSDASDCLESSPTCSSGGSGCFSPERSESRFSSTPSLSRSTSSSHNTSSCGSVPLFTRLANFPSSRDPVDHHHMDKPKSPNSRHSHHVLEADPTLDRHFDDQSHVSPGTHSDHSHDSLPVNQANGNGWRKKPFLLRPASSHPRQTSWSAINRKAGRFGPSQTLIDQQHTISHSTASDLERKTSLTPSFGGPMQGSLDPSRRVRTVSSEIQETLPPNYPGWRCQPDSLYDDPMEAVIQEEEEQDDVTQKRSQVGLVGDQALRYSVLSNVSMKSFEESQFERVGLSVFLESVQIEEEVPSTPGNQAGQPRVIIDSPTAQQMNEVINAKERHMDDLPSLHDLRSKFSSSSTISFEGKTSEGRSEIGHHSVNPGDRPFQHLVPVQDYGASTRGISPIDTISDILSISQGYRSGSSEPPGSEHSPRMSVTTQSSEGLDHLNQQSGGHMRKSWYSFGVKHKKRNSRLLDLNLGYCNSLEGDRRRKVESSRAGANRKKGDPKASSELSHASSCSTHNSLRSPASQSSFYRMMRSSTTLTTLHDSHPETVSKPSEQRETDVTETNRVAMMNSGGDHIPQTQQRKLIDVQRDLETEIELERHRGKYKKIRGRKKVISGPIMLTENDQRQVLWGMVFKA